MGKIKKMIAPIAAGMLFLNLSACESVSLDEDPAIGAAGIGGVADPVFPEGPFTTSGGVIDNEVVEDDDGPFDPVIENDGGPVDEFFEGEEGLL